MVYVHEVACCSTFLHWHRITKKHRQPICSSSACQEALCWPSLIWDACLGSLQEPQLRGAQQALNCAMTDPQTLVSECGPRTPLVLQLALAVTAADARSKLRPEVVLDQVQPSPTSQIPPPASLTPVSAPATLAGVAAAQLAELAGAFPWHRVASSANRHSAQLTCGHLQFVATCPPCPGSPSMPRE